MYLTNEGVVWFLRGHGSWFVDRGPWFEGLRSLMVGEGMNFSKIKTLYY